MATIKVLPKDLADKIAAGEVVENPSSVVKELLENSLDAGASTISIEIDDQVGYTISIEDNGFGMPEEDLSICTVRHSTSKIDSLKDLFFIQSFGFRGEALSSISSVSHMEIISRTKNVEHALHGDYSGEEPVIKKTAFHIGTKVIVKNLFYNTPARKKYLKSTSVEYNAVLDVVSKYAIVYPDISFSLFRNGYLSFKTQGNGNQLETITIIQGVNVAKQVFPFSAKDDLFSIEGFISLPTLTRSTKSDIVLYINKRYIKSKTITNAIVKGYRNMVMDHRYPIGFLNISLDFDAVDVNIHPSKRIVKLEHEEELCKFIEEQIYESVSNNAIIPKVVESAPSINQSVLSSDDNTFKEDKLFPKNVISEKESLILKSEVQKSFTEMVSNIDSAYDSFKDDFKDHIKDDTRKTVHLDDALLDPREIVADTLSNSTIESESGVSTIARNKKFGYMPFSESEIRGLSKDLPSLRIIGVFNKLYILCDAGDSLIIIDQHAAEERINYEKYLEVFKQKKIKIQKLMQPIIVELPLHDANVLKSNFEYFSKMGFEISEYGGNTFRIDSLPIVFDSVMINKNLFIDLIEELSLEDGSILDSIEYEKVALTACKTSIRAGETQTITQIKEFIIKLFNCKNPFACAHGRPTIIEMSSYELDKKFKRVV